MGPVYGVRVVRMLEMSLTLCRIQLRWQNSNPLIVMSIQLLMSAA